MSGSLPPCLGNFSTSLTVLALKGNNFSGSIPQYYSEECALRMMDLSQNHFDGKLPRSLTNCKQLEMLDVGENLIRDTFPNWLGAASEMQVMILRSNKFHGLIKRPLKDSLFPKMRIIDISYNEFSGDLPDKYLKKWNAMQKDMNQSDFMYAATTFWFGPFGRDGYWIFDFPYSITMTNKGVRLTYEKVLNIFVAVDLSSNNFSGEIPETIGILHGLQLLNLSNNQLTGRIPSSVHNLRNLESLDLSRNQLSEEIPQEMTLLSFLAFLNVSNNRLIGPIPEGTQFETFENTSFLGNLALCGEPLSNKCGNPPPSPSVVEREEDDDDDDDQFPSRVDWIVISLGVGSGLIIGVILGPNLALRIDQWHVKYLGRQNRM